jgi:hypothetical protein
MYVIFCNQAGGKLRLYIVGKLEASSSLPTPRLDQSAGLVAKASLWLPFDVEMELASISILNAVHLIALLAR